MKKSIMALIGLFAFAACSDDAFHEVEQQEAAVGISSFNPQDPGYYDPGAGFPPNHAGRNYASPWDVWYRGTGTVVPTYTYSNLEAAHYSPFVIEITPYLGLAYYDDSNDGLYHDPAQGNALIADLTNGNFPNLYKNGNEIGNLIRGQRIKLDGTSIQENEVSIGSTFDHCPVIQGNINTGYNPLKRYLNITGPATMQETDLLSQYGKVYFYDVLVYERANPANILVPNRRIQVQCETFGDPTAAWQTTGVSVNPFGITHDLVYYKDLINGPGTVYSHNQMTGTVCDSREVMFQNQYPDSSPFSFGGLNYEVRVHMVQGALLWMTSGHHLGIIQI